MLNSRQRLGKKGEEKATKYLRAKGYSILHKNYRCKIGEIDIIAQDGPVLVFIEVKTRSGLLFGTPAAAVTLKKQRQISRTAQYYLAELSIFDSPARFDVVSVLSGDSGNDRIDHIKDAFELCA
ncbi:MAG: YraN family protein [Desulforhopalus sp.]